MDYAVDQCVDRSGCRRCCTVAGEYLHSDGCQDKENSKHRRCDRRGHLAIEGLRDPGLPLAVSHREVNWRDVTKGGGLSYIRRHERRFRMGNSRRARWYLLAVAAIAAATGVSEPARAEGSVSIKL